MMSEKVKITREQAAMLIEELKNTGAPTNYAYAHVSAFIEVINQCVEKPKGYTVKVMSDEKLIFVLDDSGHVRINSDDDNGYRCAVRYANKKQLAEIITACQNLYEQMGNK